MNKTLIRSLVLVSALALGACTEEALDSARKAEHPLPDKLVRAMSAKGMSKSSPIMVRIFKEEGKLEIWKQKDTGRYDLVTDYDICKWSGKLGPKYIEGDRQAPEGFYSIKPWQMNPKSNYYLSFNIGFPNAYDRAWGRSGANLMVHGACSSSGCYSMTDKQVAEIFAFARDAFRGGQQEFQVQAFPFRMTTANMARYSSDPNFAFWKMLKEGYDQFELTKVPPKVDVCGKRYVFNQTAENGGTFSPASACPQMSQPESLRTAYESLTKTHDEVFSKAVGESGFASGKPPRPSINGIAEARLVADWSKRRARGEKVTRDPPSLKPAGEAVAKAEPAPAPRPAPLAAAPTPAPAAQPAPAPQAATQPPAAKPQESTPAAVPAPADAQAKPGAEPTPEARPDAEAAAAPAATEPSKKKWWNVFGS